MSSKRHLPILQNKSSNKSASTLEPDAEIEDRPAHEWIAFGSIATFGAWLPLAYFAETLKRRAFNTFFDIPLDSLGTSNDVALAVANLSSRKRALLYGIAIGPPALALIAGAFAGGFLVTRWGKGCGVREASLSGFLTATIVTILAWIQAGLSWAPLAGFAVAIPASSLGGYIGSIAARRTIAKTSHL